MPRRADGYIFESKAILRYILRKGAEKNKGIYGSNEGSAIGVVQAVKELGLDASTLAVVGFDSGRAGPRGLPAALLSTILSALLATGLTAHLDRFSLRKTLPALPVMPDIEVD